MPSPVFPEWLIVILSLALPFLYQLFIIKLKGWLKFLIVFILTAIVTLICGLILGVDFNTGGVASVSAPAFGWIIVWMNFVYNLFYKPIVFPKIFKLEY